MKGFHLPAKSIALIGALSLIAFAVLLNSDKGYRSTAELIAIPRNGAMAQDPDATIGDIRRIILSRPFFQQIEGKVAAEIDGTEDISLSKQAEVWAETVMIEPEKGSHAFSISVFARNSEDAQEINEAVIRNLIAIFGIYYDIRTELDLRIIEQPIAVQDHRTGMTATVALSLLSGILAYGLAFVAIPRIYFEKRAVPSESESGSGKSKFPSWKKISFNFPKRTPETSGTDEPYSFPDESIESGQPEPTKEPIDSKAGAGKTFPNERGGEQEKRAGHERRSGGPDNLPITDEIPDFVLKAAAQAQPENEMGTEEPVTMEKRPDTSREASPDEVKARLNRLLNGEI